MLAADKVNTVEVLVAETWTAASFGQLEPGDVFRLRQPDGKLWINPDGEYKWRVKRHPRVDIETVRHGGKVSEVTV